jgi:hypothetical protein
VPGWIGLTIVKSRTRIVYEELSIASSAEAEMRASMSRLGPGG